LFQLLIEHNFSVLRDVPESIFYQIPDIWAVFFTGSGTVYRLFNKLEEQLKLHEMAVGGNAQPIQMNEKE